MIVTPSAAAGTWGYNYCVNFTFTFKVAWLKMGYVVGLGLQNPELEILFQSDIRLLRY